MQTSNMSSNTIPDVDITSYGSNLAYTMGEIDDLVNVGLNYVVTVGDVSAFPDSSFTIRITPTKDTSGTLPPAYVAAGIPTPSSLNLRMSASSS